MANNVGKCKQALCYTQRVFRLLLRSMAVTNSCVLCQYPAESLNDLVCNLCLQELDRFELGCDYMRNNPKGASALESKYISGLAVVSSYKWPFNQFVPSLKFHQGNIHAKWFGQLLEQQIHHQLWPQIDKVIPIPLHPWRHFQRGYNQAQLIAQHMVNYRHKVDSTILSRQVMTRPQTELSKRQRKKNVADAFACDKDVKGLTLLLVDDVITTGNTVNQAAKVLLSKGATAVYVAAVAIRTINQ